jgi:hypothetical protein
MKKVVFLINEKDTFIPNDLSAAMMWWYGILENMGYEVCYYDYTNFDFNSFYSEIKDYNPDFIIHPVLDKLHTEFVKLREICKTFVIQSDDDYRFFNSSVFWIPFVDGIISLCGGRQQMRDLYLSHGCPEKNFLHGYWCFNPNTMLYDGQLAARSTLSHAGNIYGTRQSIINDFKSRDVTTDVITGVNYKTFKQRVASSDFSLCLTQSAANPQLRQLKGRIFELPAHTALLSEPFPDMETYYDLDKEIVIFNSVDEAVEKIRSLRHSPEKYAAIREAGKKRLLSNHTVYHVWDRYI